MKIRLLAAFLAALGVLGLVTGSAAAHSEIRTRAPAAGQTVGGEVDHIDLLFWVPVETGDIELAGPDGSAIEVGETSLSSAGLVTSVEFEPLTEPGPYTVTHTELAADGDSQTASYVFIFDPESDSVVPDLIERATGPNWLLLGGLLVIVGGLAFLFAPGRGGRSALD